MRTCALLLAAAAFASACCRPARAATQTPPSTPTIAATCQAAHDADSRVSASFCSTHLRTAASSDTRYLADAAAAEGVSNANDARNKIAAEMRRRGEGDEQDFDPIYWRVLERCMTSYNAVRDRYGAARDAIAGQRYGDVERELSDVAWRGSYCDSLFHFARGGGASPFVRYGVDNTQIALLTIAIASLIK